MELLLLIGGRERQRDEEVRGWAVTRTDTDCRGSTVLGLTYDGLNQLSQATKTELATQAYVYDDQGRRIQKNVGGVVRPRSTLC
jgi:YD repeat-containing protein